MKNLKDIQRRVNIMDNQLTEDKALFGYLIDNKLVNDEGKEMILKLMAKHTKEFEL